MKKKSREEKGRIRRALALLTAVAAVVGAAGCGSGERRGGGVYLEDDDYLITVGFSQSGEDSPWKTANTESLKSTLIEDNGYELLWEDAQEDQEAQIATLRSFIEQGVDYIVLDPIVETGWETVLKEAEEAAIPVIISNRQIDVEDTSLYTCWLGCDFREEGVQAGEWLEQYFEDQEEAAAEEPDTEEPDTEDSDAENTDAEETEPGKEGSEKYLAIVQGAIGDYMQLERMEGLGSILSDHSDWVIAGQQTAEGERERAKEVTALFLENTPALDAVIAENDQMALGVIDALKEAGISCGPDGDTAVLVFGASQETLQAMDWGEVNVAFDNSPLFGPRIAEIIQRLESGVAIDKEQYMDNEAVEPGENLDEWLENAVY